MSVDILWEIGRYALLTVLWVVGFTVGVFVLSLLWVAIEAAGRGLGAFGQRRKQERRRRKAQRNAKPSWVPTLLVDVKEDAGLLCPVVQLRGHGPIGRLVIRLEVADRSGVRRHSVWHPLTRKELGKEIPLPAFTPPDGARLEDVLSWRWIVILEDGGKELGRWHVRLVSSEGLDPEAELDVPEHTAELRGRGDESAEERLLRAIFGEQVNRV